jgi:hypothetical protein
MFSIGRVNIEFFSGWKKIKQRRISFVLGYLRIDIMKNFNCNHLDISLSLFALLILVFKLYFLTVCGQTPLK